MEIVAVTESDRERYDRAVAASPRADFMQSYGWGEVKLANGWGVLRLLALDGDGRARGACQVLRRKVRGIPPLLYAPRGPVVDPADDVALRALLDAIRERAGGAFVLKCDPPVQQGSPEARALAAAGLRTVSAGPFGGTQPRAIMELDLTPGAEKVFEGFKSKWRYNVRLAERKGVTTREGTVADLEAFHRVYRETAARDGFAPRALSYFRSLFEHLEPAGTLRMFLAEREGELLAGILVMPMGERVIYTYGASSNERRSLMPNHLLQWHAISWACEQGYRVYDFRGVSPLRDGEPTQPHLAGLNRFKEGFGARYVEYAGELDLPLRAAWYGLWRSAGPMLMRVRSQIGGGAE